MESPNLNYIKELSGGDLAFEESILLVLKKEFPEEFTLFKNNFQAKNYQEAANNVHKIKHKISILGMTKSLKVASAFEKELRNGKTKLNSNFLNILDKIHVYLGS
ncbi:Hpt domain-containing protein [Polaribacter aquimarinus]|uniref:Histidine kinase n=1 Tax=Polaribacter aquimarinus TaxID=2100726 RepID=A0A2U2J868_9FLAO|nr:Hpt domain-containing protein [Polaribacter aquimarinus]PWG04543.1 histidine kinase [Polaribacter aquimarinus]